MNNMYLKAIDLLMEYKDNNSAYKLLVEIAKRSPGVLVKADRRLKLGFDNDKDTQIAFVYMHFGKIAAIKKARKLYSYTVKEAKEYVEREEFIRAIQK